MSKLSSPSAAQTITRKTEAAPALTTADAVKSLSHFEPSVKALLTSANETSASQAAEMLLSVATASKLPGVTENKNGVAYLNGLIDRIDEQITSQLNNVIHDEKFLKLEGTWRGIQRLLDETDTNKTLWLEMLDISKEELQDDLKGKVYDQSELWKKVYTDRYDIYGGQPYSAFVSGFEIQNRHGDIEMLKTLGKIGGGTQAPFILSASPRLLGLPSNSFEGLKNLSELKNTFNGPDYTAWNVLRKNPDSRFLALTLPRVLARLPYGPKTDNVDRGVPNYEESPTDNRGNLLKMPPEHMCWSSSAYSMGTVLTKAFRATNWCTAIVGESRSTRNGRLNGGTVSNLPLYQYYDVGNLKTMVPTETSITGANERALADMGLLPLSYELGKQHAVFMGGKTLFEPSGMAGSDQFNNEFVASVLANVLPASRISHYMKRICRKFHGRFAQPSELQLCLNNWLSNFKPVGAADEVIKSKHPLQDYKVEVNKGKFPGSFDVRLSLKFWDMIYEINADVEMLAKLDNRNP